MNDYDEREKFVYEKKKKKLIEVKTIYIKL